MEDRMFSRSRRVFVAAAVVVAMSGCAASNQGEHIEEGIKAAQHEALAKAASGGTGTTPSPIPSLDAEGSVQLPMSVPPPTAPPADKFDNKNASHLLARCRDRGA